MDNDQGQLSTEPSGNSFYQPVQTSRTVKVYNVTESELSSISLMNTLTIVFFSVGSGSLSIATTILLDLLMVSGSPAQEPSIAVLWISRTAIILSLIFYALGGLTWFKRHSEFNRIKSETNTT